MGPRVGHEGLGVARIAEQLAAPLQIGADARHLGGKAEAVGKLFGPQGRLAGLSFDAGQLLFGKAHGALALRQPLNLLPTHLCARPTLVLYALRQRETTNCPNDGIGLAQHIQAPASRLRQRLPAQLFLLLAPCHSLLQTVEPLALREILSLQSAYRLCACLRLRLTFGDQLAAASLDGP